MKKDKNRFLLLVVWLLEGIVVGFGAILPGISGGTLCVAFGMYRPIIETISNLKEGIKKNWLMLGVFILGIGAGFVGLSGIANWLLGMNAPLVVCAFIGFILGTFPELWEDAGQQGRKPSSYVGMVACFAVMIVVLSLLKTQTGLVIEPGIAGYLLCGVLWGLSFIVPGLSSSSLLLFFGLYQPMLAGISGFDFGVLIPMGIGMLACLLLLSKAMNAAYKRFYSVASHCVIGVVAATAVMILPDLSVPFGELIWYIVCIIGGAVVSWLFTRMCARIRANAEAKQ